MRAKPIQPFANLHPRQVSRRGVVLAFVLAALLALPATASATKTHLFQETFGSAAQPSFPTVSGLTVDRSSGDLLVIDSSAQTVSRYHPDGTPADFSALGTNVIDAKGTGDQTPQNGFIFSSFGESQQVAVDNSGTLTDGNIYVTQGQQAAGNLIDVFASSGEYVGQLKGAGATTFGSAGSFPFSPCGVAVDGGGNLFVGAGFENKVYKFDPSANPPLSSDLAATYSGSQQICSLAVGAGPSAGSVFANALISYGSNGAADVFEVLKLSSAGLGLQSAKQGSGRVLALDPSSGHLYAMGVSEGGKVSDEGGKVNEFDASGSSLVSTFSVAPSPGGIAVDGGSERIYIGGGIGRPISVYGPLVTIPDVTTGATTITGDTAVTLNGTVNPDGVAIEECSFEYGPTASYGQLAPCAESPGEIGLGPKAVHADLSGLTAESTYHYRLVAKNPNDTVEGADRTFRTPAKPAIKGVWATEVGLAEGRLKALLNPENSPTKYRFEWGTDTSYGHSTAENAIGSDNSDYTVSLLLSELTPGTTYHYRVVASNGIGVTEGPDRSFTTFPPALASKTDCPNQVFRTGPSAPLPDCRAYEMVSPVDKNGGDIKVLGSARSYPARLDQSSDDGASFTYSSVTAFGDVVSAPYTSQYRAVREAGQGWLTRAISPPRQSKSIDTALNKFDVQYRAFAPDLSEGWLFHDSTALDECAPEGFMNLYRRDSASGAYEALNTVKPQSPTTPQSLLPELQALSADGSHAVFRANAKLTSNATSALNSLGNPVYQLYEHVKGEGCGELRLVSVLPSGKAYAGQSSAGTTNQGVPGESRVNTVIHAISADGSRIVWTACIDTTSAASAGAIYVRIDGTETVQVTPSTNAHYVTAAADGSKVIYSDGKKLYEAQVSSGSSTSTLIAEGLVGVAGVSEDASRIYFVSTEALGGEGEAGEPNLYLREAGGSTHLVATLFGGDATRPEGDVNREETFGLSVAQPSSPIKNGVRISADGNHLAFVSAGGLTGYDSRDAANGIPAVEVYLYDAESDHLACVSCNPSGARPVARVLEAGIPAAAKLPAAENQSFFPRALSADANRLFFESFDALLPRDTNGKADVYEWQRAIGSAECESQGAELYVPSSAGCLSLISTGQSPVDSEFADASPDGSDVFIRTQSSLLPQDVGLIDIYDARVEGGLPQPPAPPAACEGEACQGPSAPPNDPTPASSAFEGAGNVQEAPAKKKKAKKKKHAKKHAKKHHKQAKHNRGARR